MNVQSFFMLNAAGGVNLQVAIAISFAFGDSVLNVNICIHSDALLYLDVFGVTFKPMRYSRQNISCLSVSTIVNSKD